MMKILNKTMKSFGIDFSLTIGDTMTTDVIIGHLNNTGRFGLTPLRSTEQDNPYEHYDAENHQFIVEIKSRDFRYADWLIEKYKYEENIFSSIELVSMSFLFMSLIILFTADNIS